MHSSTPANFLSTFLFHRANPSNIVPFCKINVGIIFTKLLDQLPLEATFLFVFFAENSESF